MAMPLSRRKILGQNSSCQMGVSKNRDIYPQIIHFNRGFPWFSIINHAFWGTPIFGNTQMFGNLLSLLAIVIQNRYVRSIDNVSKILKYAPI